MKIGDDPLKQEFGDWTPSVVVYGGIKPSQDVVRLLELPASFRLYGNVDKVATQVEIEKTATKQRWGVRDKELHEGETVEQMRARKDSEWLGRQPTSGDSNVSFANLRATDLKFNKDLNLPDPVYEEGEVKIQQQRLASLEAVEDFIKAKCDSKGAVKGATNLTQAEQRGLSEIRERIKQGEWVLYTTDKSGKFCLDTPQNYAKAVSKHTQGDKLANPGEVKGAESKLNTQSKLWAKVLNVGANNDQLSRCKASLTSRYKPIPVLSGLRKDHKEGHDPVEGPQSGLSVEHVMLPMLHLGTSLDR